MIHSVLLGFKHLAAAKYLDYLNSSLFKRNKQKNSMTLSHILQLLHSFIWCHVDLSYGVLWICFGSSVFLCYHMVSCGHMWGRDVDSPRFEVIENPRNTAVMDTREYLKVVKYRDREILR